MNVKLIDQILLIDVGNDDWIRVKIKIKNVCFGQYLHESLLDRGKWYLIHIVLLVKN